MASTKISGLGSLLAAGVAKQDFFVIVDDDDLTMGAGGTNKQLTISDLETYLNNGNIDNLYTADGTLSANRTVTMGGNSLILNGGTFRVDAFVGNQLFVDDTKDFVGISTTSSVGTFGTIRFNVNGYTNLQDITTFSQQRGLSTWDSTEWRLLATSGNGLNLGALNGTKAVRISNGTADRIYIDNSTTVHKIGIGGVSSVIVPKTDIYNKVFNDEIFTIESKGGSGTTTTENLTVRFSSSYWDGATDLYNDFDIINTAQDVSGTYKVGFNLGGSERVTFLSSGNVGIGQPAPQQKLHVGGNAQVDGGLNLTTASGIGFFGQSFESDVALRVPANKTVLSIGNTGAGGATIYSDLLQQVYFSTLAQRKDIIFVNAAAQNLAYLGAESSAPTFDSRFELTHIGVDGTLPNSGAKLVLTSGYWNGSTAIDLKSTIKHITTDTIGNSKLGFEVGGSEQMYIDNNGNIIMANLPTSAPATSGALWNDAGTLKIV